MKKLLYLFLGLVALLLGPVLLLLLVIFLDPTILLNERNLTWLLEHTQVLEHYTWQRFDVDHRWEKWNERRFQGDIRDLCLRYRNGTELYACFSRISWDLELGFSLEGITTTTKEPLTIISPQIELTLAPSLKTEDESAPPDLYDLWGLLWNPMIPELLVDLKSIDVASSGKNQHLNFHLVKKSEKLTAKALGFTLTALPDSFTLLAPAKYKLPEKSDSLGPFYFRNMALHGSVGRDGIPLELTGSLEEALIDVRARLALPLKGSFSSLRLRRDFLSTVRGHVRVPKFKDAYHKRAPASFRKLPAPLNVMDGTITMDFRMDKGRTGEVDFDSETRFDLSSKTEALDLTVTALADLPVLTLRPDTVEIGVEFHRVRLELPRLSRKLPPPQFYPDKRFKKGPWKPPARPKSEATDVLVHLTALNKKALHIVTNLLDEPLRLNFDLLIDDGKVKRGHVSALPLETEIFKRPIHVKKLVVTFHAPLEPVIEATILFPLPEYKITMELEGPVGQPRYVFRSEPPLPQDDIYAVLLFGRPLQDLGTEDKTSAQRTNEILANGILSLSVLYFLAGSPVEYVGFDPESGNATAQIGLTNKTSLRVGGGQEGMNSGGVRHSLGKGWYIDTSVQSPQNQTTNARNDYGVLLERVIAY